MVGLVAWYVLSYIFLFNFVRLFCEANMVKLSLSCSAGGFKFLSRMSRVISSKFSMSHKK